MQRILQSGEIESLDRVHFPRIILPTPTTLFAERAARVRQLADGNPIADYLQFIARIVDTQHAAVAALAATPLDRAVVAQAQTHSMPLMPALEHIDPAWQTVLSTMLNALEDNGGLPEALQPLVASLRELDAAELDGIARRLLQKEGAARDIGISPFVMAALQVTFAQRASQLNEHDVPYTDPATICPVCASEPVASVLRIGGPMAGHRYLHCGTCCTEWQMVRVKCTHCESTKNVRYQGIEGGNDVAMAETCEECGTYRKVVNQEKDPMAEPLADDLASLMLDLLMSETEFRRASSNPLLYVAVAEEDDSANAQGAALA